MCGGREAKAKEALCLEAFYPRRLQLIGVGAVAWVTGGKAAGEREENCKPNLELGLSTFGTLHSHLPVIELVTSVTQAETLS